MIELSTKVSDNHTAQMDGLLPVMVIVAKGILFHRNYDCEAKKITDYAINRFSKLDEMYESFVDCCWRSFNIENEFYKVVECWLDFKVIAYDKNFKQSKINVQKLKKICYQLIYEFKNQNNQLSLF